MPAALIKKLSKTTGQPLSAVERHWEHAKQIVSTEYKKPQTDPSYWALVSAITKKMLGIKESSSFRQFFNDTRSLAEDAAAVMKYESLAASKIIDLIKQHCSDAEWMITSNNPIYRGESDGGIAAQVEKTGAAIIDPSKTERVSRNTSNYYTMIMDNNPECSAFPKRSRSLICTMDAQRAASHAHGGQPVILIPTNGVRIGIVNRPDIWDTQIELFEKKGKIETFNTLWQRLELSDRDWSSFLNFANQLKSGNRDAITSLALVFGQPVNKVTRLGWDVNFLKHVFDAYGPAQTGHTAATSSSLPHNEKKSEVWVGGPCIAISSQMWPHIREGFNK